MGLTLEPKENKNPTIVEPLKEMSIVDAESSNENPNSIEHSSRDELSSIVEPSTENPFSTDGLSIEMSSKDEVSSIVELLKENPSYINESSQEIPTSLVDHSKEKTTENFSFQVYPAIKMKQALASLCEEHFNPQGLGMIEVGEIGLEITVQNSTSDAVGHLWLNATGLINFMCSKAMINKWVNLNHIFKNLVDAADKDYITIHHLHGSNQLFFSFGSASPTQFSEELLELSVEYEKFPKITYACEAVILCDHFKEMIQEYQAAIKPKIVSVDISETALNVFVGDRGWSYSYTHGSKANGIRGMRGTQTHHAWFQWPDCEFLKKASLLAPGFLLCFAIDPSKQIMLRFNLRELGDLVYLKKSVLTLFNSHEYHEINLGLGHLATAASLV